MNTNHASPSSRLRALGVVGLLAVSAAACTSDDPDSSDTTTDDTSMTEDTTMTDDTAMAEGADDTATTEDTAMADDTDAASASSGPQAVAIVDFEYDPDPVEVAVGDTITWTNEDSFAHTVTSDDDNSDFDSGNMAEGETFEMSFDEPGEYAYICTIHTQMKATIVVG